MPYVNGKKYPYTKKGKQAAKKASKRKSLMIKGQLMSSLLIDQPGESAFHDPSLTIAQHASPYLPFEPIPFIPDDEPLDDEYHGPVFYEEEDGQGAFDFVQELFIDPNNMYADASDLTNTLEPFQNPRSGSLRDMDDESRKELLIRGVEAFKKAEAPQTITGPRTPGTIRGIPHLDSPFIDRWLRDRRNSSGPQLPHFV